MSAPIISDEASIAAWLRARLAALDMRGVDTPHGISITSSGGVSVWGFSGVKYFSGVGNTIAEAHAKLREELVLPEMAAKKKRAEAARLLAEAEKMEAAA